jgi:hypothetical protein
MAVVAKTVVTISICYNYEMVSNKGTQFGFVHPYLFFISLVSHHPLPTNSPRTYY